MDETEIDLRQIFGLLRRQFRLIAVTVFLAATAAALVVFLLQPIYASSALILVDPARKDLLDPTTQGFGGGGDSAKVDSEVEILRSNSVLLRVIESQGLVDELIRDWSPSLRQRAFALLGLDTLQPPTPDEAVVAALSGLRNSLTVQRVGLTYVVSIQARSPDPQRAAIFADAVAEAYIDEQLRSKVANLMSSRDVMQEQIASARQDVVVSEGALDNYIDNNIDRLVQDTGRSDLARMQVQIADLRQAQTETTALAEQLEASLAQQDFTALAPYLEADAGDLILRRQELAQQIAAATPDTAPDLEAELAAIDEQLLALAETEIGDVRTQIAQAQEEELRIRQQLRSAAVTDALSSDILAELFELQQGTNLARDQYQRLLGLEQDLATRVSLQVADSRIVSPALASDRPVFPNPTLIMALALIGGLGLGVLLAFLYEHLIGGFTRENQAEAVLKSKVPAAIPRSKETSAKIAAATVEAPLSVFAEAVRRLRATIDQWQGLPDESLGQVVMVTSTAPNEGKTTSAVALARSYSVSGRSVLLIDADFRKPGVHRQLGIEPSVGLLEYLSADPAHAPDINTILVRDPLSKTTLLLGSSRSGVPTDDLVTLPSFERLIDAARQAFEIVIIDTPPVGPVVDGLYIARLVDTIVFIAKWAATPQRDAKKALDSIKTAAPKARFLVVLNQVGKTRSAYHQTYGEYYAKA